LADIGKGNSYHNAEENQYVADHTRATVRDRKFLQRQGCGANRGDKVTTTNWERNPTAPAIRYLWPTGYQDNSSPFNARSQKPDKAATFKALHLNCCFQKRLRYQRLRADGPDTALRLPRTMRAI
jgi:hypothetical protein